MKFRNALVVSVLAVSLAACGSKVEVPAAHVAKIMTKDGYKADTIGTSKFRLDRCWAYCDKLVLLDASDQAVSEQMELFMPEDKLNMTFDLRLTMIINPNKYEELFARIPPVDQNGVDVISWNKAYVTYAQQIVRAEAREFLSDFTIAEIASSRETINAQLSQRLTKSINEKTPFQVRYVGLADIQYPKIIVEAQENAAERREQINQEYANLELSKVRLERELQEQTMNQKITFERARAEAAVNKIIAESVSPEYVKYRTLDILSNMANSDNKVFVPYEMVNSLAGQIQIGSTR